MTDPTNPKLPTLAEVLRKIPFAYIPETAFNPQTAAIPRTAALEAIAPYDALIASQAEEIARLTAENAELRNRLGAMHHE